MAYQGARDLYIAKITANTETAYTVEEPKRLGKVASINKEYAGNSENMYYDDRLDDILAGAMDKTLTVEVKELTQEMEALIQGQTVNKGMKVESTQDGQIDFAIGYRTKVENTGKYEFYWHYVARPEPFGVEHTTATNKPAITNRTIKFTLRDREKDGKSGVSINELALAANDTEAKALLAIDTQKNIIKWFTAVPEPFSGAPAMGLSIVSVIGATAGHTHITVTPAKESGSTYKYLIDNIVSMPDVDDTPAAEWITWDGTAEIAAETGKEIVVAELNATNKVIKAGKTTIVAKV